MGKFDGLLLVSDFDDTLYDDQRRIPERNLRAIQYFLEEGGRLGIHTKRKAQALSKRLPFPL